MAPAIHLNGRPYPLSRYRNMKRMRDGSLAVMLDSPREVVAVAGAERSAEAEQLILDSLAEAEAESDARAGWVGL